MRLLEAVGLLSMGAEAFVLTGQHEADSDGQTTTRKGRMNTHAVTVRGQVPIGVLGPTTTHEHLIFKTSDGPGLSAFFRPDTFEEPNRDIIEQPLDHRTSASARWNLAGVKDLSLDNYETAREELADFVAAGGGCVVEVTGDNGRDSLGLRRLSEELDVHVVMGAGWSTHMNAHTPWVDERSVEELTDYLTRDVTEGDEATGIRPGVLGEIGTSKIVSACEERVLRACARVSAATGYAVLVHTELPEIDEAFRIIDIATSEGMDPSRLVLGHMDYNVGDPIHYIRLLRRGVNIAVDSFGMIVHFEPWSDLPTERDYERWNRTTDDDRIKTIVDLIHAGYEDQLLLGQDISFKVQWKRYGGYGYDHLLSRVLPRMRRKYDIPDSVVAKLMVHNPARILATVQAR